MFHNSIRRYYFTILLAESMPGLQSIWLVGDTFLAGSYRLNFRLAERQFFLKDQYEVTAFCSSRFNDKNANTLSRLQITLVTAVNNSVHLPDFIIVLLDDDLIEYLKFKNKAQVVLYGSMLEWLVKEFHTAVEMKRDYLPDKAKKSETPVFYWVQLPNNKTFDEVSYDSRLKFNLTMESIVKQHSNM